jgi:hypothetical protein
MARSAAAIVLGLMLPGAVQIVRGDESPGIPVAPRGPGDGNLVLHAWGTGTVRPGEIRIPIPAEGALYEAIVVKPGLPRSIPPGPASPRASDTATDDRSRLLRRCARNAGISCAAPRGSLLHV